MDSKLNNTPGAPGINPDVSHQVINGDCLEVLKYLPDNCVDLVIMDPPYDISTIGGGTVNNIKKFNLSLQQLKDAGLTDGYNIRVAVSELMRVSKEPNIYIWCNKKQIPSYFKVFVDDYGCKFDILFWTKTNALPTYSNKYLTDCEYLLYFRKGKGKCFPKSYEDAKTVYVAPINHKDKKKYNHPTIKPLDLTRKIIRNSSREGDVILDPFAGSGTTAVACLLEGRKSISIELQEEYCNLIQTRLSETYESTKVE